MSRFQIDQHEIYKELGSEKIKELSRCFYDKVYESKNPDFLAIFPPDKEMAIQNQYEFFIQRLGGPQLYSDRKGHPALRARHADFPITPQFSEHWMGLMRKAMVEVGIPEKVRGMLDEYFTDVAFFLVNVDEADRDL
jgi:truncated hemoglobin YjbI